MFASCSSVGAHKSPKSNLLATAQSALGYFSNPELPQPDDRIWDADPLTSGLELKLKLNCD